MGNICTKRDLQKQYVSNNSRQQHSYFSLGNHYSLGSIKIIYQKIKDAVDNNHPSVQLQDQLYQVKILFRKDYYVNKYQINTHYFFKILLFFYEYIYMHQKLIFYKKIDKIDFIIKIILNILIIKAKENKNLQSLINLMTCDDPVAYEIITQHPWCQPPATIGSIAIMYISQLIINESKIDEIDYIQQDQFIKKNVELIIKSKAIENLLNNLNHKIVFLVDFEQIVNEINKKQGFDKLLPLLYSNNENCFGFRVSVGYICKELFNNQGILVEKFVIDYKAMISLLDFIDQEDVCILVEGLNILEKLIDCQNYQQKQNIINSIKSYDFIVHLQKQNQYLQLENERSDQEGSSYIINDKIYAIHLIGVLIQRLVKL